MAINNNFWIFYFLYLLFILWRYILEKIFWIILIYKNKQFYILKRLKKNFDQKTNKYLFEPFFYNKKKDKL